MYFGEGENVQLATLLGMYLNYYAKYNYNVGYTFMKEKTRRQQK